MIPCGVWNAVANAWGTEWVTGMNSTSHGPIRRRSPSCTAMNCAAISYTGLIHPVTGKRQGELGSIDRHRKIAKQVSKPTGVVLVPVGENHPIDSIRVLSKVGEVRKDQIDTGHVGIRKHNPDVKDEDPSVYLDAGTVPSDLSQPAEEDHPDRVRIGSSRWSATPLSRCLLARSWGPALAGSTGRGLAGGLAGCSGLPTR